MAYNACLCYIYGSFNNVHWGVMKIQMFPSDSEWRHTYTWLSIYSGLALSVFWFWHWSYTGEIARDSSGWPRLFDIPLLIVWVFLLLIGARFLQFVHLQPRWKFPNLITDWARMGLVYYSVSGVAWNGVHDAWVGEDMFTVCVSASFLLSLGFLLYWYFNLAVYIDRWFCVLLAKWKRVE